MNQTGPKWDIRTYLLRDKCACKYIRLRVGFVKQTKKKRSPLKSATASIANQLPTALARNNHLNASRNRKGPRATRPAVAQEDAVSWPASPRRSPAARVPGRHARRLRGEPAGEWPPPPPRRQLGHAIERARHGCRDPVTAQSYVAAGRCIRRHRLARAGRRAVLWPPIRSTTHWMLRRKPGRATANANGTLQEIKLAMWAFQSSDNAGGGWCRSLLAPRHVLQVPPATGHGTVLFTEQIEWISSIFSPSRPSRHGLILTADPPTERIQPRPLWNFCILVLFWNFFYK